ncbi:MAG: FtsQ-type POTRA domain-containing protein [Oscillospiraceae bacterium]|nr:FtsQ-type POTRA domain-containing protein [Oscillospiraceae bacterium]
MTVLLQIEEVIVTGAGRYQADEIIEASGIEVGENLLRFNAGAIEGELLSEFPYLSAVRVRRRFPHTVELVLTQYQPQAALLYDDGLAFIILEGKLLERGARELPPGLPLVRGISLEGLQPGETLGRGENPENEERLIMLRYLLEAAEIVGFPPITDVDLSDRLNIRMVHENRLLIELGSEAGLEYKLTFLNHIIQNEVSPTAQASLDASGARHRRIIKREGRMVGGQFIPDEMQPPYAMVAGEEVDEEELDNAD